MQSYIAVELSLNKTPFRDRGLSHRMNKQLEQFNRPLHNAFQQGSNAPRYCNDVIILPTVHKITRTHLRTATDVTNTYHWLQLDTNNRYTLKRRHTVVYWQKFERYRATAASASAALGPLTTSDCSTSVGCATLSFTTWRQSAKHASVPILALCRRRVYEALLTGMSKFCRPSILRLQQFRFQSQTTVNWMTSHATDGERYQTPTEAHSDNDAANVSFTSSPMAKSRSRISKRHASPLKCAQCC